MCAALSSFSRIFSSTLTKITQRIPKCPKIIHYNWFSPIINKSDRENLVKNLTYWIGRKRVDFDSVDGVEILRSKTTNPTSRSSKLRKQKYNICVRSIDELDLTKEDEEMLQKFGRTRKGFEN